MELSYPEEYSSKSSSEETDQMTDDMGTGRSYECVYCKRGFTTAQALGGHMNIHRKDRANKAKPNFPPSSSTKLVDENIYADLGFYPPIPPHLVAGGNNNNNNSYYYSTAPDHHHEVDTNDINYHQFYFPAQAPSSHIENQRDRRHLFGQDWRQKSLSLYTNPLCVHENKDKIEGNSEEDGLDLELRLGHHP